MCSSLSLAYGALFFFGEAAWQLSIAFNPAPGNGDPFFLAYAGGLAIIALLVYFWPILFGGELYYPGDTARQYLPSRVELVQALSDRAFPWWTSNIGAGYPLLAEGETGAMYSFFIGL